MADRILVREENSGAAGWEGVCALTHAFGAVAAAGGTVMLILRAAGDARAVVSVAIFGASMIVLFLSSALYHAASGTAAERLLRKVDHISIYLLIAGTYTPFCLVGLRGAFGWSLFGVLWGLTLLGIVFKLFFTGRFGVVSLLLYLAMGWLAVVRLDRTIEVLGPGGFGWLLAGGLAYTAGVPFFLWKSRPWAHAIWHLFVLAGAACHFWTVLIYLLR